MFLRFALIRRQERMVLRMVTEKVTRQDVEEWPYGIAIAVLHALQFVCDSLSSSASPSEYADWPMAAFTLIGRPDLYPRLGLAKLQSPLVTELDISPHTERHEQLLLQQHILHAGLAPPAPAHRTETGVGPGSASSVSVVNGVRSGSNVGTGGGGGSGSGVSGGDIGRGGAEEEDGTELTDAFPFMRFNVDNRLSEVRDLLVSSRIHIVQVEEGGLDHELQQAQQNHLRILLQRSLSQSVGRGIFTFSSVRDFSGEVSEHVRIPPLNLRGRIAGTSQMVQLDLTQYSKNVPFLHLTV